MTFAVTLGGAACSGVKLHVGGSGPWFADCDLVDGGPSSGATQLVIGDVTLSGTVDPAHTGSFGARSAVRIIGGGGGWSKLLPARNYPNDAGVKASRVAQDAATEAGEQLAAPVPGSFPARYVRPASPASRTIEDLAQRQGLSWWVGYDGVTQVGLRFHVPAGDAAVVLDYAPASQHVTLVVDSLNDCPIGAQLTDVAGRWSGMLTVASLEIAITSESLRVHAWCGAGSDQLTDNLRSLVARLMPQGLFGVYRYRVSEMVGDRVSLQVVVKRDGLPDQVTLDMWPGVSGVHAKLAKGTQVGVSFFGGDASDPFVASFVGRAGPAEIPEGLEIGGPGGALAARQGDVVDVLLPPAIFSGTIGGSPATGVLTFAVNKTLGIITGGSAKEVRIK